LALLGCSQRRRTLFWIWSAGRIARGVDFKGHFGHLEGAFNAPPHIRSPALVDRATRDPARDADDNRS
jgi:hypothetical protein